MPRITPRNPGAKETVVVKTRKDPKIPVGDWWNANSKSDLANKLLATTDFLKQQNQFRYRQASLYARLYGNMPLFGWLGSNLTRITTKNQLPSDRPTMSVVTSCTDTITSRLSLNDPRPFFLTDNGNYKKRNLAKQLNNFINGEFYQTKAYDLGHLALRDSCVFGDGIIKVFENTTEKKVALERRLCTQLLIDANEAFLNDPRQMYELMLVDREVLAEHFPKYRSAIESAEQAYPDNTGESSQTVADQVMIVEAWRLPSSPEATDGLHVIACTSGTIFDERWEKTKFPFVKFPYSPPQVGYWGQGLVERLMGTQNAINQLLMQIHTSIALVGVPRVFVETGSKVVKSHLNNSVGSIVEYSGMKPSYEVAPCVPVELYTQLDRLVQYAYQQEGISELAAQSQKPAGLNSGEAIRQYDDIQSDRFANLQKRYEQFYVELADQIIDKAVDIAKRDGKYQTVYPDKTGAKQIDLPDVKMLEDPFVIQCFDVSSLPREPSGRLSKVTEMMQAGLITPQEGRRLLNYPDIEQVDKLAIAGEERILKILDQIVEDGKYTPPDPFMDIALAEQLVTQYINLYCACELEEEKAQKLRTFFVQIQDLKQQASAALQPPPQAIPAGGANQPQANPTPTPQSELLPNVNGQQ